MSNRPVDVSKWNLFAVMSRAMPVALIAACGACGPVVGTDTNAEGGTDDTDPTNPTDPSDPSTLTESSITIDPTSADCYSDADCDDAEICEYGQCVYDPNCYCGNCYYDVQPPPTGDPRCSPPLDCYSDAECGYGEVCRYGYCEIPEPACDVILPVVESSFDLVFTGGAASVAGIATGELTASAGVELVVGRGAQIELVLDGQGTVVAEAPAPIFALAVGDVDGDAQADIIAATDTEVHAWLVDGGVVAATSIAQQAIGVTSLALGDSNGDGFVDVFALAADAVVVLPGAMGMPLGATETIVFDGARSFAAFDADSDGRTDIAWSQDTFLRVVDAQGLTHELGNTESSFVESLLSADFSGDAVVDLVAVGLDPSSMATVTGPVLTGYPIVTPQADAISDAAAGAVDGDGFADLALALGGTGVVRVRFGRQGIVGEFGKSEPFGCMSDYASGIVADRVVLADTLGDGTVDIVVSDGTVVRVMRLGSGI